MKWSVCGPSHGLVHVTVIRLTFRLFIFVNISDSFIPLSGASHVSKCPIHAFPFWASLLPFYYYFYFILVCMAQETFLLMVRDRS